MAVLLALSMVAGPMSAGIFAGDSRGVDGARTVLGIETDAKRPAKDTNGAEDILARPNRGG